MQFTLLRGLRVSFRYFLIACTLAVASRAESAPPSEPTLEQRVADVEAYINNSARTPDVASKVSGPGPGHNGWMMRAPRR